MANLDNFANHEATQFKKGDPRTKEAARRSAEVRAKKRECKELAKMILSQAAPMSTAQKKQMAKLFGISKEEVTIALVAIFQQGQKAMKGDLSALTFLRDTAGEKPKENVDVNAAIASGDFVLEIGGDDDDSDDQTEPEDDQ